MTPMETAMDHAPAMNSLLPCPFCGTGDEDLMLLCDPDEGDDNYGPSRRIQCAGCNIEAPFYDSEAEAIAAWNRRAGPDLATIIGALKAARAATDADVRDAFLQAALDFAENDPEVLAEGQAWADPDDGAERVHEGKLRDEPILTPPAMNSRSELEGLIGRLEDERHLTQGDGLGALLATAQEAVAALRASDARVRELEEALEGVLHWAELGFFLRDARSSSYGDRYSQPEELTIQWDWQQSTPDDHADVALRADVASFLADLTEDADRAADHPVLRARKALPAAPVSAARDHDGGE